MVDQGWSWLRWTLFGLELFVGVSATYGAIMLMIDACHLPVSDLAPLPLHSWVLPGVALLGGVAAPMLTAAMLVWRRARRASDVSIAAGGVLVGWNAVQLVVIGPQMFLQALMFAFGPTIAALAWWRGTRAVNRVFQTMTRLGLGASYRQVLTVRGRKTGQLHSTPVDVMELGGTRWLVAGYGLVN